MRCSASSRCAVGIGASGGSTAAGPRARGRRSEKEELLRAPDRPLSEPKGPERARLDALHHAQDSQSNSVHGYKVPVRRSLQAAKVPSTGRDREPPGLREPGREPLAAPASPEYLSLHKTHWEHCLRKVAAECTPYCTRRPNAEQ